MSRGRIGPAVNGALAAIVAGALSGCTTTPVPSDVVSPSPTIAADADGDGLLLALLGGPGAMRLVWLGDAVQRPLPLPDGDVTWVAGDPAIGLVATAGIDGHMFVADPFPVSGSPRWTVVRPDPPVAGRPGRALAEATLSPDGRTLVAVAADPAAGRALGRLAVVDRGAGDRTVALPGDWDGGPPAWLDPTRIAIVTRDADDRPTAVAVDLVSGASRRWPGPAIGALAVSADGTTVAWQTRDDGAIAAGDATSATAGGPLEPVVLTDGQGPIAAQLLLDPTGRRLAVAWLDDAGDTSAVAIYRRTADGWVEAGAPRLPAGTSRVVLVSLGP